MTLTKLRFYMTQRAMSVTRFIVSLHGTDLENTALYAYTYLTN